MKTQSHMNKKELIEFFEKKKNDFKAKAEDEFYQELVEETEAFINELKSDDKILFGNFPKNITFGNN